MSALAPTLQLFFTERLVRQRQASPHTLAAYRDTMRLLLGFAAQQLGKEPSELEIDDLDAPLIGAFLDHLERDRGNRVRTRNARLAAIRSLFRYAALRHPEHAAVIERVLAIPSKRFQRNLVTFLAEEEVEALLAACHTALLHRLILDAAKRCPTLLAETTEPLGDRDGPSPGCRNLLRAGFRQDSVRPVWRW